MNRSDCLPVTASTLVNFFLSFSSFFVCHQEHSFDDVPKDLSFELLWLFGSDPNPKVFGSKMDLH